MFKTGFPLLFFFLSLLLLGGALTLNMGDCFFSVSLLLISTEFFDSGFSFLFDFHSVLFSSVISMIMSCVLMFSEQYMSGDSMKREFSGVLITFVFFMYLLVHSYGFISLFVGWDGLGFSSYALVIYYNNEFSNKSGTITLLSNRVGDCALVVGFGLCMNTFSPGLISHINLQGSLLFFLLFLAGLTKSAQIPFSAWLPAAMAAPTPVSALVHSSTLVTAGAYLFIRFSGGIEGFSILVVLSGCTAVMAAVMANIEYNLKKIVAFSTLNQVSFIMLSIGCGNKELAFFHLLLHALFKALLFISVGVIIMKSGSSQDIRFYGGSSKGCVYSVSFTGLSLLSLIGLPFLSGFFSKDCIIEFFYMTDMSVSGWCLVFLTLLMSFTYGLRLLVFLSFFYMSSSFKASDTLCVSTVSMLTLGCLSVCAGSILSWVMDQSFSFLFFSSVWWVILSVGLSGLMILLVKKKILNNSELSSKVMYLSSFPYAYSSYSLSKLDSLVHCVDTGWGECIGGSTVGALFPFLSWMETLSVYVKWGMVSVPLGLVSSLAYM